MRDCWFFGIVSLFNIALNCQEEIILITNEGNGYWALLIWYWQQNSDVLGERLVLVPLCPPRSLMNWPAIEPGCQSTGRCQWRTTWSVPWHSLECQAWCGSEENCLISSCILYIILVILYGEYKKSGKDTILEDNIKVNLPEIDCAGINWTEETQNRVEWCCLMDSLSFASHCAYFIWFIHQIHLQGCNGKCHINPDNSLQIS